MLFEEYKQAVVSKFGDCQILRAKSDHTVKNCGNTGDRNAPKTSRGYSIGRR